MSDTALRSASQPLTEEQIRQATIGEPTRVNGPITLVEYDPAWPDHFACEERRIRDALGERALRIEHIGSTAVPGLIAKPIIDILLVVADSADEPSYVPALEAAGYVLRIREPDWDEHRLFKVAAFYGEVMGMLQALGITVAINPVPCEVPNPIPCDVNETQASYDAASVTRWWRIQLQIAKVLQVYRSSFVGKSSPIQFFWGSFDLSHTRFSGRPAPLPQGVPRFFQLAEDQENVACGFWPGNPNYAGVELGEPAFYAYIYPEPDGFKEASVRPDAAHYDPRLGEFILPYEAVRRAAEPERALLEFFQSTYAAAADLAGWDRAALEHVPS